MFAKLINIFCFFEIFFGTLIWNIRDYNLFLTISYSRNTKHSNFDIEYLIILCLLYINFFFIKLINLYWNSNGISTSTYLLFDGDEMRQKFITCWIWVWKWE